MRTLLWFVLSWYHTMRKRVLKRIKSQRKMPVQTMGSSNVSRLLATLIGVRAVDVGPGVFHGFCAGLGVMLTKSAKSKPCPGVLGNKLPPPGVVIMDEGRSSLLLFGGGVDRRSMRPRLALTAGDGDAARYSNRSAPSSPVFPLAPLSRLLGSERFCMGGVRGGDDCRLLGANECAGNKSSSSSEGAAKFGEASSLVMRRERKKETSGPADVVKCCCLRGLMGEDCASWWFSFQVAEYANDLCAVGEPRNRLLGLEAVLSNDAK